MVSFFRTRHSGSTLQQFDPKSFIASLGALFKSGLLLSMTDYNEVDFSQHTVAAVGVSMLLGLCESDSQEMNEQTYSQMWGLIGKTPDTRELLLSEMRQRGEGWSGLDNLKAFMTRASEDRSHEPTDMQFELIKAIQEYGEQRPDAIVSDPDVTVSVSSDDPVVAQTKHSASEVEAKKGSSGMVADDQELPIEDDEMVLDVKDMETLILDANSPGREVKVSSFLKAEAKKVYNPTISNQALSKYLELSIDNRKHKILLGILEVSWHRTQKQWADIVEMLTQIDITPELQRAYRAVLLPQIVVYLSAGRGQSRENTRVNGLFPADFFAGIEGLVESGVLPRLTKYNATEPLPPQASTMATELLLGICDSDSPAFDINSHLSLWRLVSEHKDLREQFFEKVQEKGATWSGLSNLKAFVENASERDYSIHPIEQAEQSARKEFIGLLKAYGEYAPTTHKDTVSAVIAHRKQLHQQTQGKQGTQSADLVNDEREQKGVVKSK